MSTNGPGHPPKLTQAVHDFVVQELKNQNYIEAIVQAKGISRSSYYGWLKRGAEETLKGLDTIYTRFAYAVEVGKAEAQLALIGGIAHIAMHSQDEKLQLDGSKWIAERKHGRWNKTNKQISVDATKEDLAAMDDDELRHLMSQTFPGQTPDEEGSKE